MMTPFFIFLALAFPQPADGGQRIWVAFSVFAFGIMILVAMTCWPNQSKPLGRNATSPVTRGGDISMGRLCSRRTRRLSQGDVEQLDGLKPTASSATTP
jgi:hypothetical protein